MAGDPVAAGGPDGAGGAVLDPIRFDTAELPETERFPAFAASSPNSRLSREGDGPFAATAVIWPLDEMILTESRLDPFTATRDARQIRARPADHYMAIVPLTGRLLSEIDGVKATCLPGSMVVNDYTRTSVTVSTGLDVLVLTVSRAFLGEAIGGAEPHGVLPPNGETRLFIDFLCALAARLPDTRRASVPVVSRIVRDLLAMAIRAGSDPAAAVARTTSVRARVRRHIAALPPGEIDLPALMADLGLSRSSLFRAFRQDGGVLAYDRQRRLRILHRLLVDANEARGIAELGFACGFHDMPALSRLFRATFGYTMRDLRRHADHPVTPLAAAGTAESSERYRALVSALS